MPCSMHPVVGSGHWGQITLCCAHLGPLVEKPCDGLLGIELAHWERPKLLLQHQPHCQEHDSDDGDSRQFTVPTLPMMFSNTVSERSGRHHGSMHGKHHVLLKPLIAPHICPVVERNMPTLQPSKSQRV